MVGFSAPSTGRFGEDHQSCRRFHQRKENADTLWRVSKRVVFSEVSRTNPFSRVLDKNLVFELAVDATAARKVALSGPREAC